MAWLTSKNTPPRISVATPNLAVLGLTVYAYVEEDPQNWGPLGPCRLGIEVMADR